MNPEDVDIVFQPGMSATTILHIRPHILVLDGQNFSPNPFGRGWMIPGMGIVNMLMPPIEDAVIRTKIADADNIAFVRDANQNVLTVIRGYGHLKPTNKS